jgi:DNA-binding FadR family transcriptional regulator
VAQASAQRELVSDRVFESLLEALLSGRYAPGEKLPPQRALAAEEGVTMSSVREALKRLEQMGLLEVRHGDAMRVRDWRAHGGLDVIAHLLLRSGGVDAGILAAVFEARELMLENVAALAAQRRTDASSARLQELAAEVGRVPDATTAQRIDFAFFAELARSADNLVFVLIMNSIRSLYFEHAAELPITSGHAELVPLYERAAQAVAQRRPGDARAAVRELARHQRDRVAGAASR